jgi:addiction module HigA family antidote
LAIGVRFTKRKVCVIAEHADKLRGFLARLDAILTAADMDVPGLRPHQLIGREKGLWAVTVRANWRVLFRFADHLGVTRTTLSELVNGKRGISPEMALRLSKVFGGSAESWLVQQAQYDLAQIRPDRKRLEMA